MGGRLTLIKLVLGSIGIYYMSFFKVPEGVLKSLENLRIQFSRVVIMKGNKSFGSGEILLLLVSRKVILGS